MKENAFAHESTNLSATQVHFLQKISINATEIVMRIWEKKRKKIVKLGIIAWLLRNLREIPSLTIQFATRITFTTIELVSGSKEVMLLLEDVKRSEMLEELLNTLRLL